MTQTKRPQAAIMVAFATVCTDDGRFGVGAAERHTTGYWPLPSYGSFDTWEAASARVAEINAAAGIEPETAASIVASSMRRG